MLFWKQLLSWALVEGKGSEVNTCGEEHKRMLGATGRGTKKQAAQLHGYVVNNREFNMASTQSRAVGCLSSWLAPTMHSS